MAEVEIRKAFCEKLQEIARKDKRLVILESDLMSSSGTKPFFQEFPERAINVGIAEANMVGIASGLCLEGFIPFATTFGIFASRRVFDQFFLSANYAKLNVKLVGSDPGVSATYNGGTHMPFEDVGLMRMIPNLVIAEPSDATSASAFDELFFNHYGSTYLRLHRKARPLIYGADEKFEIGRSKILRDGGDITLISLGSVMLEQVLLASDELEKIGIKATVIDSLTVKPFDREMVIREAKKTGHLITCENCNIVGGIGSEVSDIITDEGLTCKLGKIGIQDRFGQVGSLDYLINDYGLSAKHIVEKAKALLKK